MKVDFTTQNYDIVMLECLKTTCIETVFLYLANILSWLATNFMKLPDNPLFEVDDAASHIPETW